MKRLIKSLAVIAIGCGCTFSASGFGKVGHATVAKIAQNHLTPTARATIEKYLGGDSIVNYASWMDQVRKTDAYKHTDGWHTAQITAEGKTPKVKLYKGLSGELAKVQNGGYKNMTDSAVAVAIKLIVHMAGDMHCPSHSRFLALSQDRNFKINGEEFPFHKFFDSGIMGLSRPGWTYVEYANELDKLSPAEIAALQKGELKDWIKENAARMKPLYGVLVDGADIKGEQADFLIEQFSELEEQQMQRAGYRLAGLLNSIFDSSPKWITTDDNHNTPGSMLCFYRDVNLDEVPASVPLRIGADSKYWMWINGNQVVLEGGVKRGPIPGDSYMDEIDIAKWLKPGENRIAVQLWYFGKDGFSHKSSGQAGLFIDSPNLSELNTNSKWYGRMHPAFFVPQGSVPNYRLPESNIGFDARYDIPGWQNYGWSGDEKEPVELRNRRGGKWISAKSIGREGDQPWGNLHPRIIPMWKDYGRKSYVATEVRKGETRDTVVGRLPYNCHAMPYIKLESPAGEFIEITSDNYRGGSENNVLAQYITKDGEQEYENMGWMNAERIYYIVPRNVKVKEIGFHETGYDTEFAGKFACSDEFLNKFHEKAMRTLYVTMRDTYMDCPDRERSQWWGDVVNESGEAFYALSRSADKLMKKGMYELINWQRPDGSISSPVPGMYANELPGQMLASVGHYGFYNYYLNTGDLQPMADLYDGVKRYLSLWEKAPDGSVADRNGGWHWGDWGDNIDKIALYNCLHRLAQQGLMEMAQALGKTEEADSIAAEMASIKKAFNKTYWNGKAYRHPDYKECTDDRVQALAVVSGMADPDKYPAILKQLRQCRHASPYMEKYVTEAYFKMGAGKEGLQRMKERYAKMINHPDYSTLWEGWGIGAEGFGGGTTNHAWSGGGRTILSQYVCGIAPIKPGYEEFSVAPQLSGLEWVETVVPTVKGDIDFKASEKNNTLEFSFNVPEGTTAVVTVPKGYKKISCNSKSESNGFRISTPGTYTIKATK